MKKIFFLLLTAVSLETRAQGISIGDTCPDVELTGLINYPRSSVRLSEFRGKLLLLDFWATYCAPCVASFKKGDSLQKVFAGRLQILPVTQQDRATVSSFLEKMKKVIRVEPPSATGDRALSRLFPHASIPHYVWIDGKGRVVGITDHQEVTAENIRSVLEGRPLTMKMKQEVFKKVYVKEGLFQTGILVHRDSSRGVESVDPGLITYQSTLTRYQEGVSGMTSNRPDRFTAINETPLNLLRDAYGHFDVVFFPRNRIYLEVRDSSFLTTGKVGDEYVEWLRQYGFCYELRVPGPLAAQKFQVMQQEVGRYFAALYGVECVREKQKVECLALRRTTREDRLATRGGTPKTEQNAFYYKLQNMPLRDFWIDLVYYFQQNSPYPLLDESGYTGKVDLEISARLSSMTDLNKALEPYGLQFVKVPRLIDVLVVRDLKK